MSKTEKIAVEFPKEWLKYAALGLGLLLIFIYGTFVLQATANDILLIFGLIFLAAISRIPQRMAPFDIGVELVSLSVIVGAITFHWMIGALIGITAVALSRFYTIERPQDVLIMFLGLSVLAYFTPAAFAYFGSLGITAIVLTLTYDLITNTFYVFMGHSWMNCIRFSAMHVPSNYFILKYLGPKLLGL